MDIHKRYTDLLFCTPRIMPQLAAFTRGPEILRAIGATGTIVEAYRDQLRKIVVLTGLACSASTAGLHALEARTK